MIEYVFLTIGISITCYAIIAFTYRTIKGEAFSPNLKKMVRLAFDVFWGIGQCSNAQ